MENEQEGMPLPDWSRHGSVDEMISLLGDDFNFMGPGWYQDDGRTILICPTKFGNPPPVAISAILALLGVSHLDGRLNGQLVCYCWAQDPRPRITSLLQMGNQTEVPVPPILHEAWPRIAAAGESLKQWFMKEFDAMAAGSDVSPLNRIEFPGIGPEPSYLIRSQVKDADDGVAKFKFGPYVVCIMSLEALESLRVERLDEMAYTRLFSLEQTGLAVSLQPPTLSR